MEHAAQWLQEQEEESLRENVPPITPSWLLLQQEFPPIDSTDSSNYPYWLTKRRGITPKGFPFSMTQEEFEKIYLGSSPTMSRANVVNFYNMLINYFNQLDLFHPKHIQNFKEWQKWWGKSLDLVIPKSDLLDEYFSIYFKGSANMTIFDEFKLRELEEKIGPFPERDEEPKMLDLANESSARPLSPYVWDYNVESNYERNARLNRASGKYKRTKKHKKYKKPKKYRKKNGKNTHYKNKH